MENTEVKEVTQEKEQAEKTFTQAELNAIVASRVNELSTKYENYEELKAKAAKFDEAEEASKSELQKATERANELQGKLDALTKATEERALRDKVSAETGVPASLLRGSSEADLKEQANAILGFVNANKASYPQVKDGGETVTPSLTKEQILSIKSEKQRLKAIQDNIELFK